MMDDSRTSTEVEMSHIYMRDQRGITALLFR